MTESQCSITMDYLNPLLTKLRFPADLPHERLTCLGGILSLFRVPLFLLPLTASLLPFSLLGHLLLFLHFYSWIAPSLLFLFVIFFFFIFLRFSFRYLPLFFSLYPYILIFLHPHFHPFFSSFIRAIYSILSYFFTMYFPYSLIFIQYFPISPSNQSFLYSRHNPFLSYFFYFSIHFFHPCIKFFFPIK